MTSPCLNCHASPCPSSPSPRPSPPPPSSSHSSSSPSTLHLFPRSISPSPSKRVLPIIFYACVVLLLLFTSGATSSHDDQFFYHVISRRHLPDYQRHLTRFRLLRDQESTKDAASASARQRHVSSDASPRIRRAEPFEDTSKLLSETHEENERARSEVGVTGMVGVAPPHVTTTRESATPNDVRATERKSKMSNAATSTTGREEHDIGYGDTGLGLQRGEKAPKSKESSPNLRSSLEEEAERSQVFPDDDGSSSSKSSMVATNDEAPKRNDSSSAHVLPQGLGDEDDNNNNISSSINATSTTNKTVIIDQHDYYKTKVVEQPDAGKYWVELDNYEFEGKVETHTLLSNSHRRAATIQLSFDFNFYGHKIRNITIATGGFLYTGTFLHNWLAATQYIAPLMANFDTSQSQDAMIRYFDNGTHFTVEWRDVRLQEEKTPPLQPPTPPGAPSNTTNSSSTSTGAPTPESTLNPPTTPKPSEYQPPFNFQVTLLKGGDIIFAYKDVPQPVKKISTNRHPVKVGLSDAYIIESIIFMNIRRRTVYEYHRVDIPDTWVKSYSAIFMRALTTCNQQKTCSQCIEARESTNFDCQWCQAANRCSDGLDRHRQNWLAQGCQNEPSIENREKCKLVTPSPAPVTPIGTVVSSSQTVSDMEGSSSGRSSLIKRMGVGGVVIGVLVILILVLVIVGGVLWAYCNPNSTAGLWLIEHRPQRLKTKMMFWKNNGAEELEDMEGSPGSGDAYNCSVAN